MKKFLTSFLASLLAIQVLITCAAACTTIMVGSEVSADGSHFIGRTVDSHSVSPSILNAIPARNGQEPYIYHDKESDFTLELPGQSFACLVEPTYYIDDDNPKTNDWWESGINEKNVGISATESINTNDEILAVDPFVKSGISESNIPTLVLPYISSAREGVTRLGALVEQYGMISAEAVAFIDEDEIWYAEIYSGHHWAARRMPADAYACIGNDAILGFYDPADTENWIASEGIVDLAKQAGSYKELDGKFHLALSFGTKKRNYSQLRIWESRRAFNPSTAGAYDVNRQYEIFEQPEKKIALTDAFELTRNRNEGTPEATDLPGSNARPIGIDRTGQSHFIHFRDGKTPVLWSCLCAPEFGLYVPVYSTVTDIPDVFSEYSSSYSPDCFTWQLRDISNMASSDRALYSDLVRSPFSALERSYYDALAETDSQLEANGGNANEILAETAAKALDTTAQVKSALVTQLYKDRIEQTNNLGQDLASAVSDNLTGIQRGLLIAGGCTVALVLIIVAVFLIRKRKAQKSTGANNP